MKHKYRQKYFLTYGIVVLIVLVGAIVLLEKLRFTNFIRDPFYVPQPDANSAAADSTLSSKSDLVGQDTGNVSKNTAEIPVSSTIKVSIDSVTQDSQTVTYRASISNGADNGTCSAVFTKDNSKPVTRVTTANSGSCGPVSIPNLEFESVGIWTLSLRYFVDGSQAVATQTVEVH